MIRPHESQPMRYLDYGKVFVPNGALDFSTLAYSDSDVARFGPQLFNRGLLFPENSPFASQISAVSAALLAFEGGFLFTLIQRRREGELSLEPRTNRPFNQVRFVILTRDMIEQAYTNRVGLYASLVQAAQDPAASIWLRDYSANSEAEIWSPEFKRVDLSRPNPETMRFVVNALMSTATPAVTAAGQRPTRDSPALTPQPISVSLTPAEANQEVVQKLQFVDAIQYWALPRLGVLTFALDYVSIQNVHLRLFPLPADAPAPLPPERVFRVEDAPSHSPTLSDFFTPISTLAHEELYDPSLPGLLALPITPAEAIRLFKIEKYGEPLSGAEAQRLYPELARLGERRLNLLRRVPRQEADELLRQADLPHELRLDLLQLALEAAHHQLVLYVPTHLRMPRAARDDEGTRALLRTAISKSPDASLDVWPPAEQAELFRDLLLARRRPAANGRGVGQIESLSLTTGQPLLEALLLTRRTPALASALQEVVAQDPSLFSEALTILDQATDLKGLLWLWQQAGRQDFRNYCALLERAVQPAWYAKLARDTQIWHTLLAEGRALAIRQASTSEADSPSVGALLHALPRALVPFVWQASLATAEYDAAFAEWWLYNEALALPEQLPALWEILQRLSDTALQSAGPELNYLLGRSTGLSLLQASTPPGQSHVNEALYATALRAWLGQNFHTSKGDLALATDDVEFLIAHLPESNDILAAIATSSAQAAAFSSLGPESALHWAKTASGERRQPYRSAGKDFLFTRLSELPAPDEPLLWHLLIEDEGTAGSALPWSDYLSFVARSQSYADALGPPPEARLSAYLATVSNLQNLEIVKTFQENSLDLRRLIVLLSPPPADIPLTALTDNLLPLTVFHLQETNPDLKERAAHLLREALQSPGITTHLQNLPDPILSYLRQNFCHPQSGEALAPTGHWIEAELSRRNNTYRLKVLPQSASAEARSKRITKAPVVESAPTPPAPEPTAVTPLLGQVVLPGSTPAPKRRDTAVWLWVAIVVIVLLILAILIGLALWIPSLS